MGTPSDNLAAPVSLDLAMTWQQARRHVKRCFDASPDNAVLLLGPPGVGKTSMISDVAKERSASIVPILLNCYDPSELKGNPKTVPDGEGFKTVFARNSEFPASDDTGEFVFFIDDVNVVPPSVQTVAFQMTQQRRITASYNFPKNNRVALAGNRLKDRSAAHLLPMPLIGRISVIEVIPDAHEWVAFARETQVHPAIIAYVVNNPDRLIYFTKEDADNNRPFPSPRAYVNASNYLNTYLQSEVVAAKNNPGEWELLKKGLTSFLGKETVCFKREKGSLLDFITRWADSESDSPNSIKRKLEATLKGSAERIMIKTVLPMIAQLADSDTSSAALYLMRFTRNQAVFKEALRACPEATKQINANAQLKELLTGAVAMAKGS